MWAMENDEIVTDLETAWVQERVARIFANATIGPPQRMHTILPTNSTNVHQRHKISHRHSDSTPFSPNLTNSSQSYEPRFTRRRILIIALLILLSLSIILFHRYVQANKFPLEILPTEPIPAPPINPSLCNFIKTKAPLAADPKDPFKYYFTQQLIEAEYINEAYCRRRRRLDSERVAMQQQHFRRKQRPASQPVKLFIASEVLKYFNRMEFDTNPKWTTGCSVPCMSVKDRSAADVIVNGFETHPKEQHDAPHAKYAVISTEGINPDIIRGRHMEEFLEGQDITINYNPHSDVVIAIDTMGARAPDPENLHPVYNPWYGRTDGERWDWTPRVTTAEELANQERSPALISTFISNCANSIWRRGSIRNAYLTELGKHIGVRNFGKCSYGFKVTQEKECPSVTCKVLEQNRYKFSSAFQNTMQYGYVDEKIWDAVSSWLTVPVYWGAPDVADYMPADARKMMIIASDFSKPKDLADYLQYLDRNHTAYEEYFEWRKHGYNEQYAKHMKNSVSRHLDDDGRNVSWMCRTCEFYHQQYDFGG